MIALYDMDDNFIKMFDTYKECANYFETTTNVIYTSICRIRNKTRNNKKWDKKNKRWVKIYKMEDDN